jgi:hypothetical protein
MGMLRQPRTIIVDMRLPCVVLVLVSAHLATAQENPFRRSLGFVGCYELRVLADHPSSAPKTDFLPRRFELTTRPSSSKGAFVARNLDSKVADSSLMSSMSSWNANLDGTVHIVWSTRYVGYDIQLGGSGTELRGTAHYFTDTDPFPRTNRNTPVVAQRVACKESGK